jgi:hypothetical protein
MSKSSSQKTITYILKGDWYLSAGTFPFWRSQGSQPAAKRSDGNDGSYADPKRSAQLVVIKLAHAEKPLLLPQAQAPD